MGIRDSFSRLKKKIKHPLKGRNPKPGRTEVDASGGRLDPTGSPPRPEPHIEAGGSHDQEDERSSANGLQFRLPQPDHPEPALASTDENDQGEEETRVEVAVGSGPSGEGIRADGENAERACPSPSTPSIPHIGKPGST